MIKLKVSYNLTFFDKNLHFLYKMSLISYRIKPSNALEKNLDKLSFEDAQ